MSAWADENENKGASAEAGVSENVCVFLLPGRYWYLRCVRLGGMDDLDDLVGEGSRI